MTPRSAASSPVNKTNTLKHFPENWCIDVRADSGWNSQQLRISVMGLGANAIPVIANGTILFEHL